MITANSRLLRPLGVYGVVWDRTVVDGVPTYWAKDEGDLAAFLVFRAGVADEQLALRGITHLVEHLVMSSVDRPAHTANGQVGSAATIFGTRGDADEVTGFLTGICQAVSSPVLDRLEVENRIIRAEANQQSRSFADPLMVWRYGAATYGLTGYREFGIGRHTPEQITAWTRKFFTRENAVLVLAGGPPPPGLTLDLPAGERVPPPVASSALPRTPAYFVDQNDVVAMNALVRRSMTGQAYTMLLGDRLQRRLRQEAGLSYSPGTSYDPRDGDLAHVTAVADGLPENFASLVPAFVRELELLAEEAASAREIEDVVTRLRTGRREGAGGAFGNAIRELFGCEPLGDADLDAEIDAVDADGVRRTAAEALDSALLMLPAEGSPGRRFREAPQTSDGIVDGQTLRSADAPIDASRLVIGDEGVSFVHGPRYVTVSFGACEAMLAWPDGARRLIGRDGFVVTVEPTLWAGGSSLPSRLDAGVPADRIVPMPERSDIPAARTSRYERIRARFRHR
jgi:zinc protease